MSNVIGNKQKAVSRDLRKRYYLNDDGSSTLSVVTGYYLY